ncbi:MAG: Rne/Rng family ribonuclease, partial [Deltaproteobacteria bacterium]
MSSELILNVTARETRVALLEDGTLAEFYREWEGGRGIVGNICKGRVVRIHPGIQSAFVEIGEKRTGFLYVSDAHYLPDLDASDFEEHHGEAAPLPRRGQRGTPIEDLLVEGEEILVQVAKAPLGSKGARLTTHLTLPGRYLVLMPFVEHVGVSRRIEEETERRRLKEIVMAMKPPGVGFIVRTVAENHPEEQFQRDMNYLLRLWRHIERQIPTATAPTTLYTDLPLQLRVLRDLFTPDFSRIVVDSERVYREIEDFFRDYMPDVSYHLESYDRPQPIFEFFGIERALNRALNRKIWLRSGGYIVIDQTEALTTIDVNTGRFVGKQNFEETVLRTNLEAVTEIVDQLRLRNIGGIIIVDFIDMDRETNRNQVYRTLTEALKRDRMKTNILKISDLGLIEMTRKRTHDSLLHTLCEPCPYCQGKGVVKSVSTVAHELLRALERSLPTIPESRVVVRSNPAVAECLWEEESEAIAALEATSGKTIRFDP